MIHSCLTLGFYSQSFLDGRVYLNLVFWSELHLNLEICSYHQTTLIKQRIAAARSSAAIITFVNLNSMVSMNYKNVINSLQPSWCLLGWGLRVRVLTLKSSSTAGGRRHESCSQLPPRKYSLSPKREESQECCWSIISTADLGVPLSCCPPPGSMT